jgi:glycosyltransferase involved in cell wall biosynthesis
MQSLKIYPVTQPSLSIIVPVFNEASNISDNIKLLTEELSKHYSSYDIYIISDGSTDDTNKIINTIEDKNLKLICLEENQGKGAAIRIGFSQCRGDFILFIDGGMELHPKEIKMFMGLMSLYSADMVIGSKRHPQSKVFYPWYRRFLSIVYQKFIRILFSINVTDTQVGIKLFKGELVRDILPYLEINQYGFDLEIICLANALGYHNILEAPIRLDYFLKNRRSTLIDIFHTVRVGRLLLFDTIKLYFKIKKLKLERKSSI